MTLLKSYVVSLVVVFAVSLGWNRTSVAAFKLHHKGDLTMSRRLRLAVLAAATFALGACGTTIEQKAATGAVAGAVVAGPVGAAVGGAAGAVVGQAQKPN